MIKSEFVSEIKMLNFRKEVIYADVTFSNFPPLFFFHGVSFFLNYLGLDQLRFDYYHLS